MRVFFLLIFMLCVATAKDQPRTILESLPEDLAGCTKDKYYAYDEAGLGGSIAYKKTGLVVTVYAYDLGKDKIADGTEDPTVKQTFTQANEDIFTAQKAGYYSKVERIKDGFVKVTVGALVSRYVLTRSSKARSDGLEVFSEIHVFGARDHIIKFRISGDLKAQKELHETLQKLLPLIQKAITTPAK